MFFVRPSQMRFDGDQRIVLLDLLGKGVEKRLQPQHQIGREIAVDAADAIVIQGQAGPAELFEHIQQCLALPECPEEHRHRADIEGLRSQPKEVADDALHLRDDRPDILRPFRHRDVEEFFDGPHVRIVVRHGADVVEPVRVRDDLHIGQTLGQFLDAAMQVAEVRRGLHDPFAVQLEHDAQHTVRARMLRPHVQQEFFAAVGAEALRPLKGCSSELRRFRSPPFRPVASSSRGMKSNWLRQPRPSVGKSFRSG